MNKRPLRLLLVEDDEEDFLLTRDLLGEIVTFDCDIEWTATYAAAKKAIAEKPFDVCLIDYRLGEHTGLELLREAVAGGFRAPMILLSGQDNHTVDVEAMNAGAADYLLKEKTESVVLERSIRYALERQRTKEILEEAARRERAMIENAPDVICTIDADGRFVTINPACLKIWGYHPEELIGRQYIDLVVPEDVTRTTETEQSILSGEAISGFENHYRHKNGTIVDLIWTCYWSETEQLVFAVAHDITERKRAEEALARESNFMQTLMDNIPDAIYFKDTESRFIRVSKHVHLKGIESPEEAIGKTDFDFFDEEHARAAYQDEQRIVQTGEPVIDKEEKETFPDGTTGWVLTTKVPIFDANGKVTGIVGASRDITERKRVEEQLIYDALHDNLTGLANRVLFTDHLQRAIERTRRDRKELFAVLFLDFDRFKVINDSLGHAEGDNLLMQIARRLESSLRSGDVVARLGGDEFTILVNKLDDSAVALRVADRIQKNLQSPFEVSGSEIFISASIGIALSTTDHDKAEDMLRDADIAMYRAKAKGKAQHQVFDQAMHEQALAQLRIETELRQAIEQKEFCLHYQPIFNLKNNQVVGFESLVRWQHPEIGIIPPHEFIPVAEDNGLIIPLGQWILNESCRQLREWQISYPAASRLTISVNLSFKQFLKLDLAEQVAATLEATGLGAQFLKLEITESHLMENSEKAVSIMNRLRSLGVELSLDDFGTGYSSLSYLHRLPVSYLKVDRSFISQMIESAENSEIVSTIVKLAQNLKMKIIAEGIETEEQLVQLQILGCEYGQGYLFAKPMDAVAAVVIIKNLCS